MRSVDFKSEHNNDVTCRAKGSQVHFYNIILKQSGTW